MKRLFSSHIVILVACFYLQASNVKEQKKAGHIQFMAPQSGPALKVNSDFSKIPLQFIPNKGQMDELVSFYVQGRDLTIFFTDDGLTFLLDGPQQCNTSFPDKSAIYEGLRKEPASPEKGRWVVKLNFLDANEDCEPEGLEASGSVVSYFVGRPDDWKVGLEAFSKIIYRDLWPGIDLIFHGTYDQMKYEFIVNPGANPSSIRFAYLGAENVSLTERGALEVNTPAGRIIDDAPVAYQEYGGKRIDIFAEFILSSAGQTHGRAHKSGLSKTAGIQQDSSLWVYGFEIEEYDQSQKLVIDPAMLIYCGYIGGSGDERGMDIDIDESGNAYITGWSSSPATTFPLIVGPDLTYNAGDTDAFVAKVNAAGTALVYCGYIGGVSSEYGISVKVDAFGNAYIIGDTWSYPDSSFPVIVGPDLSPNGMWDTFIAKVNAAGTNLIYCGYIGGSSDEYSGGIDVDDAGNAYITGRTDSTQTTFPVILGPDLTSNGVDAYIARVNASGTALDYCGFIGGYNSEQGHDVEVDSAGNAYVTGFTSSDQSTFPVKIGPDITYNGGLGDAFLAKVNATGTDLDFCGYIGGSGDEWGQGLALDSMNNAYITGYTHSDEQTFPVTLGPDLSYNGNRDAFVAKVGSDGKVVLYCGYVGGQGVDNGRGIAVDQRGNAYITGDTGSSDNTFPIIGGPDLAYNGLRDAFIAKVNESGSSLSYCGYIGGVWDDIGSGIVVDTAGNAFITGDTKSGPSSFPVLQGPDLIFHSGFDAFVAKIVAPARVDFNGDLLEDILWRYCGSGGHNRAWYLGNSDGAGSALTLGAVVTASLNTSGPLLVTGVEKKSGLCEQDRGVLANRMKLTSPRSSRNPMMATGRQARFGMINDPRRAGGSLAKPSGMSIADPRLVNLGYDIPTSSDIKLGSKPSVLGGGDVMPVGDLTWQIVGTGDFNNDTHVDILWRNTSNGSNVVWYMDGVNWTGSAALITVPDQSWKIVGTGDFNNDTHVDILWRNTSTGSNIVWYMSGAEWIGSAEVLGVGDPAWQIVGTGDFNRDGQVDILWRYAGAGGYDVVWYMNGVNWSSSAELIHVGDLTWQIAGTGDYDNDGNVDILWRYDGTGGYNVIWYMTGVAWRESAELIPVPDLNWKIVSR